MLAQCIERLLVCCQKRSRDDKCSRTSTKDLYLEVKRTLLLFLPCQKLSSYFSWRRLFVLFLVMDSCSSVSNVYCRKDTEVSPRGLLLDNQTVASPVCLSLFWVTVTLRRGVQKKRMVACVNHSSFQLIALLLCNRWKINDYVMRKVDMTYSFLLKIWRGQAAGGSTPEAWIRVTFLHRPAVVCQENH